MYRCAGSNGGRTIQACREIPKASAQADRAGAAAAVVLLLCDSLLDVLQVSSPVCRMLHCFLFGVAFHADTRHA